MLPFLLEEIWKRKFSSGQTLARERRQFSRLQGKSPVKRVEQNLWTEVSRKVLIQPILGMSLALKRKELEN